jgi:Xaa-Pro dipeptidase
MWSIPPPNLKQAEQMFDFTVAELGFTDVDDVAWMESLAAQNSTKETLLHVLSAPADATYLSYPTLPGWILNKIASLPRTIRVTSRFLQKAFHHARLIKTEQEISYIREACRITSGAHEVVMRELGKFATGRESKLVRAERNGKEVLSEWEIESEGDAEAVFVAACRRAG